MSTQRKWSRWFRFRLRTLLLMLVVVAGLMSPLAAKVQKARNQKRVVMMVAERWGRVTYDWADPSWSPFDENYPSVPRPSWAPSWLGDEYFQTPVAIEFLEPVGIGPLDDQPLSLKPFTGLHDVKWLRIPFLPQESMDLSGVENFPNLEYLDVRCKVSDLTTITGLRELRSAEFRFATIDLAPLAELDRLSYLNLRGEAVTNLSAISRLKSLQYLTLAIDRVHDLSPIAALEGLRGLELQVMSIADIKPLTRLVNLEVLSLMDCTLVGEFSQLSPAKRLKSLYLCGTPVTNEEIARLRRALPECTIRR